MLTKALTKIDRYYPILVVVIIGLIILIIYTLRGVFSAVNTATEFDPEYGSSAIKIQRDKLDEVYTALKQRNIPSLTQTP